MASTFKLALATILTLFVTQGSLARVPRPQSYWARSNPEVEGARIRQSGDVLEPGVVWEKEIAGGEVQSFGLNLTQAQFISVLVIQRGANLIVSLINPDQKKLFEVNGTTGGQGAKEVYWVAETGGSYRIDVHTFETKAARSVYSINLKETRLANDQDRSRVAAQQALSEADALAASRDQKGFSAAVEKYKLALPIVQRLRDKRLELRIYTQLGDLSSGLRRYVKAKAYYQQAINVSEALGEDLLTTILHTRIESVDSRSSHTLKKQSALDYYDRALAIIRDHQDKGSEAEVLTLKSESYRELGMYRKQAVYLERAAALYQAAGRRREEAEALDKLAELYREKYAAKGRQGLESLKRAADIYQQLGDSAKAKQVLISLQEYENEVLILEAFERSIDTLNRLISETHRDGGQSTKEKLNAAIHNAESLDANIPKAPESLALLLDGDETGAFFPGGRREGPVSVLADLYSALGSAYEAIGDTKRASDYFDAAVEKYESVDGTEGAERAREKLRSIEATGLNNRKAQGERPRLTIQSEPDEDVFSLAFSPDGRILAASSFEGTIKLWDTRSGLVLDTLASHVGKHPEVNFGPKGRTLAVSGDGNTELWNVEGGELIRSVNGAVTFSADEELVASYSSGMYKSDVVNLWDTRSGRFLRWLKGHEGPSLTVSFSPDDQFIATGGVDRTVRIWDTQQGTLVHTLECHNTDVVVGAFNKDGSEVVSYDGDSISISWDAHSGKLLKREPGRYLPDERITYSSNGDKGMTFSPDGRVVAHIVGTVIELRDATSGQLIRTLSGSPILPSLVQFSDDGKSLVIVNNAYVTILDLQSGDFIKTDEVSNGGIVEQSEFSFSPDEDRDPLSFHIVSPDGRVEISNSLRRGGAEFRDLESGRLIRFVSGKIYHGHFSHDSRRVILDKQLRDARTGALINTFPKAISVGFSRDSKIVVGLNYETARNPGIFVADARTGQIITGQRFAAANKNKDIYSSAGITDVNISNDLKRLAITESGADGTNGGGTLYNAQTGKELASLSEGNGIFPTTFSPDSKLIAAQNNETEINLIDTEDGSVIDTLTGHSNYVESLDFSPDSKLLVSSSLDGTIKFWNVESGEPLATLLVLEDGNWLAVAPDGLFDGTVDAMQQVSWRVSANEAAPVGWFFNDFYYPGLLAEIAEGSSPTAKMDIATMLQLPGLRTMLSQGLARIEKRNGKSVLCFNDKPTAKTQVYSDAQPFAFDPNDLTFHEDDAVCRYQKELPDDKQYEVVNTESRKTTNTFKPTYDGARSATARSTLHILSVAVDNYDLGTSGFKALPGAIAGAKEVERFFLEEEKSTKRSYQAIRIWPGVYDHDATREKVRQRLADLAKEVKKNDVVFLFFSGHGIVPAGQEMFYFAPVDMRGPSPEDQRDTGLSTAMLAEAIRKLPVNRVVLIIDACQSGGAIESLAKIAEVKARVEESRAQIENREKAARRNRRVGVYIIAAATPLQEAVQPKAGNGALVSTLLETLRDGQSASREIWIRDLVNHIEQRLPEVSAKIGQRHTPMIVSIGVDFPISSRRGAAPRSSTKNRVYSDSSGNKLLRRGHQKFERH